MSNADGEHADAEKGLYLHDPARGGAISVGYKVAQPKLEACNDALDQDPLQSADVPASEKQK
jgi:hypothetical protein